MTEKQKAGLITQIRNSYFFQYKVYVQILLRSEKLIILFKDIKNTLFNPVNTLERVKSIKKSNVLSCSEEIAFEKLVFFHFPQRTTAEDCRIGILSHEDFCCLLELSSSERNDMLTALYV